MKGFTYAKPKQHGKKLTIEITGDDYGSPWTDGNFQVFVDDLLKEFDIREVTVYKIKMTVED